MIEVSNSVAQTIPVGGSVSFDKLVHKSGCGECHNAAIPTSVKLCAKGIYDIQFNGNITAAAANTPIQLAIAVGGAPIIQTAMNASPAAANALVNVSAGHFLRNCCCDLDRISVINTGANPLTIAPNSSFRISRRA